MIPPGDTEDLTFKDHFWLILFAVFVCVSMAWLVFGTVRDVPDPARSRYHDATLDLETQPITTPQEFYEREKAGLHDLEETDLETTAGKLDRIRWRDAAARESQISDLKSQIPTP